MKNIRTYMDYNATSPLRNSARAAMIDVLDMEGNPSSVHREGRKLRSSIDRARAEVARLCHVSSANVTFTSGATEAASHILTPNFQMGKAKISIGRLLMSAIEHPCVLSGGRFPAENTIKIPVNSVGLIDIDLLERELSFGKKSAEPDMVAIMLVNNETGIIQPMNEISALVKKYGGILVVDAVQAAGRISLSLPELGADFLLLSSHKLGGPKGAGALVCAGEILMPSPLVAGGGQEKGHRSGTENPAAIAGFGAACREALECLDVDHSRLSILRGELESGMQNIANDVIIHGANLNRVVNTTLFSLPNLKSETAQIAFDLEGVALSTGSACSSGKVGRSHVLEAMKLDADQGALRVSIGHLTTMDDIANFLTAFKKVNENRMKISTLKSA